MRVAAFSPRNPRLFPVLSARGPRTQAAVVMVPPLQQQHRPRRRPYATPADAAQILEEKRAWDAFPDNVQQLAVYAEHARSHNYQIPLISSAFPGLDGDRAYHVAAATRALRESANGEVVAGRKLAFLPRISPTTSSRRGVPQGEAGREDGAVWSYMYRNSIVDLPSFDDVPDPQQQQQQQHPQQTVTANLRHLSALEPRLEPTIVVRLASHRTLPTATMSDAEILGCVEWIAPGFEVGASIFPGWKFTTPDAIAGFALHGLLLVGPKIAVAGAEAGGSGLYPDFIREFAMNGGVELKRDGRVLVEGGNGGEGMGNPLKAVRQLAELLVGAEHHAPLQGGEILSTGALTPGRAIRDGEVWESAFRGISLPGLRVRFRLQ